MVQGHRFGDADNHADRCVAYRPGPGRLGDGAALFLELRILHLCCVSPGAENLHSEDRGSHHRVLNRCSTASRGSQHDRSQAPPPSCLGMDGRPIYFDGLRETFPRLAG